jgi:hypothetical protein
MNTFVHRTKAILLLDSFSGTGMGLGVTGKRLEADLTLTRRSKTSGGSGGLVLNMEPPLARCGIRLSQSNIHGSGDELLTVGQHTFARDGHRGSLEGAHPLGQARSSNILSSRLGIQPKVNSSRSSLGSQEQGLTLSWRLLGIKHKPDIIIANGHGEGRELGKVGSGVNLLDLRVSSKVELERSRSSILLAKRI